MQSSGNNIEYRFAESNGARICYHVRGSGEPLILIMGFGAPGTLWEKHAAVYEQHFRCILIDNRGVGRSDQPAGPYSTALMAADVIAVMDHAQIIRAHVAGISMGGAIAQELAIIYPQRVATLLLISTWGRFNNYTRSVYENLKILRAGTSREHFTSMLQLWIFAPPYFEQHAGELKADALASAASAEQQSQEGFEGQLDACIHHDTVERLHLINVPTLITVGSMDIFTPPPFSELLHQQIRNSEINYYSNGGHVHHWEDLDRFNTRTTQFLLERRGSLS